MLAMGFSGKRTKNGFSADETDNAYTNDSGEYADAVNEYIPFGRPSAGYHGLMIFVTTGKGYTEASCNQYERNPA